jgi:hypothetical protein
MRRALIEAHGPEHEWGPPIKLADGTIKRQCRFCKAVMYEEDTS